MTKDSSSGLISDDGGQSVSANESLPPIQEQTSPLATSAIEEDTRPRKKTLIQKIGLFQVRVASGINPGRKLKHIFPENGMSVVERYFVHTPAGQPQVTCFDVGDYDGWRSF